MLTVTLGVLNNQRRHHFDCTIVNIQSIRTNQASTGSYASTATSVPHRQDDSSVTCYSLRQSFPYCDGRVESWPFCA